MTKGDVVEVLPLNKLGVIRNIHNDVYSVWVYELKKECTFAKANLRYTGEVILGYTLLDKNNPYPIDIS